MYHFLKSAKSKLFFLCLIISIGCFCSCERTTIVQGTNPSGPGGNLPPQTTPRAALPAQVIIESNTWNAQQQLYANRYGQSADQLRRNGIVKIATRNFGSNSSYTLNDCVVDYQGRLHVSTGRGQRIVVFNRDGSFYRALGRNGGTNPRRARAGDFFRSALGLAIDRQGRLLAVSQGLESSSNSNGAYINVFEANSNYNPRLRFGNGSSLNDPQGVAVGPQNLVYVSDRKKGIQIFSYSPNNNRTRLLTTFARNEITDVEQILTDQDGTIYVIDKGFSASTGEILVYSPPVVSRFGNVSTLPQRIGTIGARDFNDDVIEGIALYRRNGQRYVFASNRNQGVIYIWNSNGNLMGTLGGNSAGRSPEQLSRPNGLTISGNKLYVVDSGNNAIKIWQMTDIIRMFNL